MATLYSKASAGWSAAGTFNTLANGTGTDTVPGAADAVTIQNGHTVTLDATGCACLTLTVASGGKLTCSTTANSDITFYNEATVSAGGKWEFDLSAAASYACTLKLNGAATGSAWYGITCGYGAGTTFKMKGANRKRWTRLNGALSVGATSAVVDDATGWAVGDRLVLGTTQAYNATPRIDEVVLTSVSGTTVGWTGGTTYAHADNGYVGNLSSNLTITSADVSTSTKRARGLMINNRYTDDALARNLQDISFYKLSPNSYGSTGNHVLRIEGSDGNCHKNGFVGITNCAFYDTYTYDIYLGYITPYATLPFSNNIFHSSNSSSWRYNLTLSLANIANDLEDCVVFSIASSYSVGGTGSARITGWAFQGYAHLNQGGFTGVLSFDSCSITSATVNFNGVWGSNTYDKCSFGVEFGATCNTLFDYRFNTDVLHRNCTYQAGSWGLAYVHAATSSPSNKFSFLAQDVGGSADDQRLYKLGGEIYKDTSVILNGLSSLRFEQKNVETATPYSFDILVAAGETVLLKGNARRDTTTNVMTVEVSGTTVSATGTDVSANVWTAPAGNSTWLPFAISISHAQSIPVVVTVTMQVANASVTTGKSWFDGIPDFPFCNKVRWYGYNYDETTKTRTVNAAITEATEATAYAYTGIAVGTGTAPALTGITLTVAHSFVELYDYTQAWARANIAYNVPLTASVAGMLTAQCNLTATAAALSGAGSILMGSYTLTASGYTYTGGTFSQLASTPAFSGGTVSIAAEGTYDYTLSSCGVEFGAAGTAWDLSGATISGTVAFTTSTGALAVTVAVPTGTSYTVEGANITVTAPIVSADISITGMANTGGANNRLQVINSSALAASDWQAATAYAAGDVVLRTSGVGSENTAGLYMRCTSGGTSHATTEPTWDTTVGNTTADNSVTWTTYSVLYYDADPAGTSLTDTYIDGEEFLAGETIEIRFAEEDPAVSFKTYSTSVVATTSGFSALVIEDTDTVYAVYGISGVTQDSIYSPNFVANYIVLDTDTNFTGAGAYAYYCYLLTTTEGMYCFWGGITGIDPGNIRNNVDVVDLYFDESAGFVRQTDDVRIFKSDGSRPALDPTTGGAGIEINWKVPVNVVTTGGSSVLPQDVIDIADAVWAKTLP